MYVEPLPVPTVTGLRIHLDALNQVLTTLRRVALHPRARVTLAAAQIDLSTAQMRLDAHPDMIERENLDVWLRLVHERLRLVSHATVKDGAYGMPDVDDDDSCPQSSGR